MYRVFTVVSDSIYFSIYFKKSTNIFTTTGTITTTTNNTLDVSVNVVYTTLCLYYLSG